MSDKELTVVPQSDTATIMHAITVAAADPQTDVMKMERMMSLYKELRSEQAKAAYAQALDRMSKFRQTIPTNRTGEGPGSSRYAYADWPQMEKTIRPWLSECGLSLTHRQDAPVIEGGKVALVMVYATLRHRDGHSEEVSFPAIPNTALAGKLSPSQLLQQSITYAKRQTAAMILGLSTQEDASDEDENAAEGIRSTANIDAHAAILEALNKSEGWAIVDLTWRDPDLMRQAFGKLNTKQKSLCRELEGKAILARNQYINDIEQAALADDVTGALQLIEELEGNDIAKSLVRGGLDPNTRDWIKKLIKKEAA